MIDPARIAYGDGAATRSCGFVVSLSGLALTKASLRACDDGMISLERSVSPWAAFARRSADAELLSIGAGRNAVACSVEDAEGVDGLWRSCFSEERKNRPDSLACWAI